MTNSNPWKQIIIKQGCSSPQSYLLQNMQRKIFQEEQKLRKLKTTDPALHHKSHKNIIQEEHFFHENTGKLYYIRGIGTERETSQVPVMSNAAKQQASNTIKRVRKN